MRTFKQTYKQIENLEIYQVILALEKALEEKKAKMLRALGEQAEMLEVPVMSKVRWDLFKGSLDSHLEYHRTRVERRTAPKINIQQWSIPFEKQRSKKRRK